ncbi:CU044_5270 family protein [Micromonospora sp. NPDC003197]
MDDLRLLREVGQETPPATPAQLASARSQLLAAATAASPAPGTVGRANRWNWRFMFGGLAAAGVAAAVAGVVVLAPGAPDGGSTPDAPVAQADPAWVLMSAATTARQLPDITPQPHQFVYRRSQDGPEIYESWLSVDGTRDGLVKKTSGGGSEQSVIPGCRNGRAAVVKGGQVIVGRTEPCTPDPAYHPDLPTDAAAMKAYLLKNASGEGEANSIAKDVASLAADYLRPQSRAALYEAAATVPGLRVVKDATDSMGRSGIGIAWPTKTADGGKEMVMVFDAKTYAFLGFAKTSAELALTVVDRVGQTG